MRAPTAARPGAGMSPGPGPGGAGMTGGALAPAGGAGLPVGSGLTGGSPAGTLADAMTRRSIGAAPAGAAPDQPAREARVGGEGASPDGGRTALTADPGQSEPAGGAEAVGPGNGVRRIQGQEASSVGAGRVADGGGAGSPSSGPTPPRSPGGGPGGTGPVAPGLRRRSWPLVWLGVAPFFAFALLFLILPTLQIVLGAFRGADGGWTLDHVAGLFTPSILASYAISIRVSLASALLGCGIGFAIAAALIHGGLPGWLKGPAMTFSGVASQFAGVPLAFAFLATLGRLGLVTVFLREWFGVNIYAMGFNLLSFWGLTLTYLYFQIPLMILVIAPALEGLKREWSEAAEVLGASRWQYWRMVALPILWPAILGTFALLFANAFGAVATAYALTGSSLSIVPILLFAQIRGDVLGNPGLGYALAFGMIVITGLANLVYLVLRARAERWIK